MSKEQCKQLTEAQEAVVSVLRESPNVWMTVGDLFPLLSGYAPSSGVLSNTVRHLTKKSCGVYTRKTYRGIEYMFSDTGRPPENSDAEGNDSCDVPICGPFATDTSDSKIIMDALCHYATSIIETHPATALRCAYLAGSGEFRPIGRNKSTPVATKKSSTVTESVQENQPEPIMPEMPEGMTQAELAISISNSGVLLSKSWSDLAKRVGMDADYFERIATNQAPASVRNLNRVYGAVFMQ